MSAATLVARARAAWTPAQLAAAAIGVWWTVDGVLAFLLGDQGRIAIPGSSVAVDYRHGLFHLVTGLCGLATCAWPNAARRFLIAVGVLYLSFAVVGLVDGGSSFGLISVDRLGSIVHLLEGSVALAAGLASRPVRRSAKAG